MFSYIAANERAVYTYNTSFLFQELFILSYSNVDAKPLKRYMTRTQDHIINEATYAVERVCWCDIIMLIEVMCGLINYT